MTVCCRFDIIFLSMHHWRLNLSTIGFIVAGLGIIVALGFMNSIGANPWLTAKIVFLFSTILFILGK